MSIFESQFVKYYPIREISHQDVLKDVYLCTVNERKIILVARKYSIS